MPAAAKTSFIIIGAGISGILMGIKLRERGFDDFVILEKGETLGGTWRDNVYPGVACDVAAHLYVYSFAPAAGWRSRYAKGADIWAYYAKVARQRGILPHIRYNKEVVSADWDGAGWRVEARDGAIYTAGIVIAASGRLHHPVMPDIAGANSFAGPAFHTARWDRSVDVKDKRIGVIGTGSTATQVVAALAGKVPRLSLFQRTPQWVFPVQDTPVPWWRRLAFRLSPAHASRYYYTLRSQTEARGRAATGDKTARAVRDQQCFDALATVRDPVLRAKLTPDYDVGCKRLVMSGSFYEAVQKPGVDVVTEPIDHIEAGGIVTRDGTLHPLDVLVFATGFDAHAYIRPMRMTGEQGVSLDDVWRELPLTYRSMMIPHMPNFLMINGPYSPGGTASVVGIVETQVDYLLQLIDRILSRGVAIAPREAASHAWLEEVRERARESVWGTGGCQSWYLDKSGTPTIDPSPLSELQAQLAHVAFGDYVECPLRSAPEKERIAVAQAQANGITLEFEVSGPGDGKPLLLIHGVGAQLVHWPDALVAEFAAAGFRVIRYDNRDTGRSTWMSDAPIPDLAAALAARARGEVPDLPYGLAHMAADATGLLDALGIGSAHVLGVSLGGMIAQQMAIAYPARVRSLAILMSQSGNPDLPGSDPQAIAALSTPPPDPTADRAGYLQHVVDLNRIIGSPAYPSPVPVLHQRALVALERGSNPAGAARHLAAGRAAADRREPLQRLSVPTLVIHGADDRLIPVAGGEDIAAQVPNAWLLTIKGMGHDLPEPLFGLFVAAVTANTARMP